MRPKRFFRFFLPLAIFSLATHFLTCSLQIPNLQIQGSQDPVQGLLFGDIPQIPSYWLGSIQPKDNRAQQDSALETLAEQALQTRSRLREEIDLMKANGLVGETASGMLELLILPQTKEDSVRFQKYGSLIAQENRARTFLLSFLAETFQENIDSLRSWFFQAAVAESPKGTRIQHPDGSWSKK